MGEIVKLTTRRRAAYKSRGADLGRQLRLFMTEEDEPIPFGVRVAFTTVSGWLYRQGRSDNEKLWPGGFVMLSRDQTEFVWQRIMELPGKDRPVLVRDAFVFIMLNIRQDTGELTMGRDEFAAKLGVHPDHVTRALKTLARIDVLIPQGAPRGGVLTYKVNPHVGWNGNLEGRKAASAEVEKPSLKLVGGSADTPKRSRRGQRSAP